MARIAGVDLPPKKRAEIGLTYIYGIGRSAALKILAEDTEVKQTMQYRAEQEQESDYRPSDHRRNHYFPPESYI